MMMPIGLALLRTLEEIASGEQSPTPDHAGREESSAAPTMPWLPVLGTALVLGIAYAASIGGTLTPVGGIGRRLREVASDALFLVDAVASIGGAPLDTDAAGIDFCLLGSQKCLSAVPDLGMVAVSERGWARVAAARRPPPARPTRAPPS